MPKPEHFWTDLLLPGISFEDAFKGFAEVCQNSMLPARDPQNLPLGFVGVKVHPTDTPTHCLFKHPSGRQYPELVCPGHYKVTRGERYQWIRPILKDPDNIFKARASKVPKRDDYFYVCDTIPSERFIVIVHRKGKEFWIGTAYDVNMLNPRDSQSYRQLMQGVVRVVPQK